MSLNSKYENTGGRRIFSFFKIETENLMIHLPIVAITTITMTN